MTAQWNYVLFVGEKEAQNGTVDITDRDDQKKRQVMGIAELNEMFKSKLPPKGNMYNKLYAKAWKPPAGAEPAQINTGSSAAVQSDKKVEGSQLESIKVSCPSRFDYDLFVVQAVANMVGAKVEVQDGAAEMTAETKSGKLQGVTAIMSHLARMKPGLFGKGAFQAAKVDEWIAWA